MKKAKGVICVWLLAVMLSGCAQIPDAKEENGITQAKSNKEKEIGQIVQAGGNADLSEYEYLIKEENGYQCKARIGDGENVLNIDAPISVTGENGVSIIEVKSLDKDLSEEKIREALFKDIEGVQNVTNTVYDDWEQTCVALEAQVNESESAKDSSYEYVTLSDENMILPETPHYLWLKTEDDLNIFLRDVDAASIYFNSSLEQQVKDMDKQVDGKVTLNEDVSADYTMNMAWEQFEQAMNEIGITDLQQINCRTYTNGNGKGYYSFAFTKCIDGIPLLSDRQRSQLGELMTVGSVEITEDGIAFIQGSNILWEEVNSSTSDCIHVGQLVQILNEYVETDKIKGSAEVTFKRLELSYQIITEDWKTAMLKPVWRLYIPLDELIEGEVKVPEGVPTDILIDAVTGELISKTYY